MDFRAFEAAPGISVILKPDALNYIIQAVSNDFLVTTGYTRSQLLGKNFFEIFKPSASSAGVDPHDALRQSFSEVVSQKQSNAIEALQLDLPGVAGSQEVKQWSIKNAPLTNDEGEVEYIIHSLTEKMDAQAEQSAGSSKGIEKAYNFFINAPVVIGYVKGDDYVIDLANESLLEVWGRTKEVIGKPLIEAIPELEEQGFISLLDQVRTTGESFSAYEYPITLVRGGKEEIVYFDFVYKPYYENGTNEKATGVISVGHNVTERVLARQKVQESEDKYSALFNAMDQGFCVLEMIFDEKNKPVDYKFLETNPVFEKQSGLKDATGKTAKEMVPNLEAHWFELYGNVAVTGEPVRFTESSDAMGRWFDVYAFPIGMERKRNVAILFTDISERKKAEDALRSSESNLRNMILQSPVAMGILRGPSFVVEIGNDRLYELWGRSKSELVGKPIFEGLPEVRNQGFEELLNQVYNTGESYSAYAVPVTLPRNGEIETVYINFLYEPFKEGDGKISGVMAVAIDVSRQVRARLEVEKSNRELQFVMNVMPQMVWVTLSNGYHEFYNNQWYDYTGLTYEQSKDTGWDTVMHPDDKERAWQLWRKSLATGERYEVEYRFRRHDGVYRWFLGRALPLKDEEGNITKWFGTCTDIDDQVKAAHVMEEKVKDRTRELQMTIQELERSNANLEDFAYAASHDLKEPIRKIRTFSDRLRNHLQDRLSQEDMNYFQRMDNATTRMQYLIDDLLEYSHVATNDQQTEEIDLNRKLALVLEDLELEIARKNAIIEVGPLPTIKGHRRQVQQLFQNLTSNAVKFHKPCEPPHITISSTMALGKELKEFGVSEESYNSRFHKIVVKDKGIGFEQKYADKIFKMFQRLHGKAEYDGTGIGLAIARKVVENHHGFITAESAPGEGATFTILLPA